MSSLLANQYLKFKNEIYLYEKFIINYKMNYNKGIDDLIEHYNKVNYLYNCNDNKDKVKMF